MKDFTKLVRSVHPPLIMFFLSLILLLISHSYRLTNISFIFLGVSLIFLLDVKGRVNDFVYLKDKHESFFCERVLSKYAKSWCGRTVVRNIHPESSEYFYDLGYRWYHFLPDRAFSKASPFLSLSFWVNLFSGHRR